MASLACSPRVVGTQRPDYYSLETLLASPPFAGLSGEKLALAIYDHFTSTVDGSYHWWPMDEHRGEPRIRGNVVDPVKLLNAYGFMICGQCSAMLYNLYRAAGFKTRQIGVPGHSLCEVFYEGRWHIIDVDMWTWFRTPQGHIASAFELAKSPTALIVENRQKSNPCNLPDRSLKDYAQMYAETQTSGDSVRDLWPPWALRGHTMDFYLRPGEAMTRSQTHAGRFHFADDWLANMKRYPSEWKGHPRERYEPFRSFGNGTWTYEPNLSAKFQDYAAGVWEATRISQDAAGLSPNGSRGVAIFRIRSPYPFVGKPSIDGQSISTKDGVWLEATGSGNISVEITDCEGVYQTVVKDGEPLATKRDITAFLDARYECLLRFTLNAGARLERFKFHGYTMTAPMSIPRLLEGANPMALRCLDKRHQHSEPWTKIIDFRASADLKAQALEIQNAGIKPYVKGWQMIEAASGSPLRAVFKFDAPAGRKLSWAYVLASAREGLADGPPRSAMLEWSADGSAWHAFAVLDIPQTPLRWDGSIDGESHWDVPLASVFMRVTCDTAITALEFHGHLDIPEPHAAPLQITHRWVEADGEHEFSPPSGALSYSLLCRTAPRDHTIEMRMQSLPAK